MSMRYPGGLIATTPVNQQFPSGVWTGPQSTPYTANNVWANDSSFKNTTLLLHGDGATTPFTKDASTNNFQLTIAGDTKPNNLTPFITNGYWSNLFVRSSSQYLTVSNSGGQFSFGTGAFTIECWVNLSSLPSSTGYPASYWIFGGGPVNSNPGIDFYINNTQIGFNLTDFTSPTAIGNHGMSVGTWYHVAVVRGGGSNQTVSIYVNGTRVATASSVTATADAATTGIAISAAEPSGATSGNFDGYISNHRIVKGTAVYDPTQSTLTVPTAPLTAITNTQLLTCQSNRFVDNSSNAFTITTSGSPAVSMQQPFTAPSGTSLYGSGYFDGSGDYLTSPNVGFASSNFTIEGWFYPTTIANLTNFWGMDNGSGSTPKMIMYIDSSGNLTVDMGNAGTTQFPVSASASTYLRANAWNHIAVVRSGTGASQFVLYINGTSVSSGQLGTNISSITAAFNIGYIGEAYGQTFSGYVSNFRIVNGTAVYTGNFTPSTSPLTSVTNTSLLTLQTNGPATNSGFLDSSYNSFPITRNGNTTQGSFNPYQTTGYWSNAFDGSGDYLTIPSSSTFSFTGDFTWEAWVYLPVTTSGAEIVSKHLSGITGWYMLVISGSLTVQFVIWNSSNTSSTATSSSTIKLGQWNHIAGGRYGSTVFACLNGVYTSSALTVTPRTTNSAVNIGANLDGSSNSFNGYISNLRCASYAVYTGNYTVPTAPLTAIANTQLLTCQSNRFKDNSSNNFALTSSGNVSVQNFQPFTLPALQYTPQVFGGSGYFDGSGDYLTMPSPSGQLGSGDFTVEAYIYPITRTNLFPTIWGNYNSYTTGALGIFAGHNSGNTTKYQVSVNGAAFPTIQSTDSVVYNQWTHIAVVRNSGVITLYVNGVANGTYSISTALNGANSTWIGTSGDELVNGCFNGYISNSRVVKGTAIYTSAFTPPTAPLTAITNTQLLVSYTNAAIFDNTAANLMETVGDVRIDTATVKYGTSSMYFDGTGDTLTLPASATLFIGTVDFTAEAWIYPTSVASARAIISFGNNNVFYLNTSAIPYYGIYTVSDTALGSTPVALNTWTHIAFVRSGTTLTCYLNGVSVGTATTSSSIGSYTAASYVGSHRSSNYWLGYIDDLRITKGVARYVTNFTPPVARMPNQ